MIPTLIDSPKVRNAHYFWYILFWGILKICLLPPVLSLSENLRNIPKNSMEWIPCKQLVSPMSNERRTSASNRLLFHQACTSSFQKNANFSPKALTKERFIPSLKYCIYLGCGLHVKPKFKAFLPSLCGFPELVEHNTSDPNNNSKQYNRQQVCKSYFKRLDVIKIKNRSTLKALEEEFQWSTACIVSKNHWTSFYILTQTFAVDLDFDRLMVGLLKRSICAVEHMHASLNQLLK